MDISLLLCPVMLMPQGSVTQTDWTTWPPRDYLVESLVANVQATLNSQNPETGRFGTDPWVCSDQNVIFALAAWLGLDLVGWTVRALFGLSFRQIVELDTVWMAVGVLSLLGLLYLAAAVAHRWVRLGYVAIGMLLAGWMMYAFYIQAWDRLARVQWYAIPAGLYLLGIGYEEWTRGHKGLARWLDYAAMLLMMGSLFWQTMLFGWGYATLLGLEGFLAFWWGSARRLRRFFYAGMVGVILAVLGQLINSLRSINQWIVFGLIGLLLVMIAVLVERKLEEIKLWQEKILETWE